MECRNGCGFVGTVFMLNSSHKCPIENEDVSYFLNYLNDVSDKNALIKAKVISFW